MSLTELPALPYSYDALEPYIDTTTMTIHYGKHHQTYVNNVKAALEKFPELSSLGLVGLNEAVGTDKIPSEVATAIRNNAGGHYNHTFFWKIMGKPGDNNGPSTDLKAAIDSAFGSLDALKSKFNAAAAARFGSGWAWLIAHNGGGLEVVTTPNQDNPLQALAEAKGIPVLGLDVWEHAYYLKYQNRRPEYISAWWSVVNWEQVNANFEAAKKGTVPV